MGCCCKTPKTSSCLGRCDLPKHRCLDKCDVKPGPIPRCMGWLWDAKTSPEHQLRCGWRPGHIFCPVLRRIELHNSCSKGEYYPCPRPSCARPSCNSCSRAACGPPCPPSPCATPCPTAIPPCCVGKPGCSPNLIRIIRHAGNYSICMKPSTLNNSPSGPYPLRYVINTDADASPTEKAKFSVEAKFNDYHFDYTTSQTSFVLDFSPPDQKTCPRKSVTCMDPCGRMC